MLKNKTHRIISISPTSQNSSLKASKPQNHNQNNTHLSNNSSNNQIKTLTPIKCAQQHATRSNTIKSVKPVPAQFCQFQNNCKQNDSVQRDHHIELSHKNQQNIHKKQVVQSILVSSTKNNERQHTWQFMQSLQNTNPQRNDTQARTIKQRSSFNNQNMKNKNGFDLDQILNKIGKNYQQQKRNHSGVQLVKKTQINYLRQIIRQAKHLSNYGSQQQYLHNNVSFKGINIHRPNSNSHSNNPLENKTKTKKNSASRIQTVSFELRQKISLYFSSIHKQLYSKQKQLYERLDDKIFELKEKNITKFYQAASLKNYIQKCQSDINSNYQGIMNQLDIKQLNKIVNSYTQKLEYYMDKLKVEYFIDLKLPQSLKFTQQFQYISVQIQKKQQKIQQSSDTVIIKDVVDSSENQKMNINILQQPKFSIQKFNRLSFPIQQLNGGNQCKMAKQRQKQININTSPNTNNPNSSMKLKTTLQQLQNLPLNKILMRKNRNNNENQPRIASARGKY